MVADVSGISLHPHPRSTWAELSDAQRLAVERVLLRADAEGPATDHREVGASFLTIVEHLAVVSPVLLVIDDLQKLVTSSQKLIAYAARRFARARRLLGAIRTDSGSGDVASWCTRRLPSSNSVGSTRPDDLMQ